MKKFLMMVFCLGEVSMAMQPKDLNEELPSNFVELMPKSLKECAELTSKQNFEEATSKIWEFAQKYPGFRNELLQKTKKLTQNKLEAHFHTVSTYYDKELYDKRWDLSVYVKNTLLGTLYWSYCSITDCQVFSGPVEKTNAKLYGSENV